MAHEQTPVVLPRILIVSRQSVRNNKLINFVGEYHLNLLVRYGAVPIIVPRVAGISSLLSNYEPIHGVLLCEGGDVDPSHYATEDCSFLSKQELDDVRNSHSTCTVVDEEKDLIVLRLAKLCVENNIPLLGICRGSQVLNVACGGTLYQDLAKELSKDVVHMNYENYDGHRHGIKVAENTPLHAWFKESVSVKQDGCLELQVNSYHHQGVKRLAERFVPMAFANDGLIEGFFDPREECFLVGLQFHPERMQSGSGEFDYEGCPTVYQEFVKAASMYQKTMMKRSQYIDACPSYADVLAKINNTLLPSKLSFGI